MVKNQNYKRIRIKQCVLKTSCPVKVNQSMYSVGSYVRSRKCAAATGLRIQHPSPMQICAAVCVVNEDKSYRQLLVAVAFLWDEILECLLC